MLLMMLARDSHLGMEGSSPQAKGCRLRPGHRNLLQLRGWGHSWLQVHGGSYTVQTAQVGLKAAELQLRSWVAATAVTQRTQWRGGHSRYWIFLARQSSHTSLPGGHAPPIWLSAVQFWVLPCCTHLSLSFHPMVLPAGDDRRGKT